MKNVAVYSRKSIFTGKGDSISNQIELCKNYLNSNYPNEEFSFLIYEDEGFSGSNINRPKFKELLNDAKNKNFSILICYRLDRISRNVADFSNTLTLLQKNNIDFISIKEQFDTTSPMGRAMMYISSVFAQLERETIAERVRDNLLELSKTGRFLGGSPPLGFTNKKKTFMDEDLKMRSYSVLSPINKELNLVKKIYNKYLELKSITGVTNYLYENSLDSFFKTPPTPIKISRLLRSPLYVKSSVETHNYIKNLKANVFGEPNGNGYLTYNKKNSKIEDYIYSVSSHVGIIDSDIWLKVQTILDANSKESFKRIKNNKSTSLLSGKLQCAVCLNNMIIKKGSKNKNGQAYTYYVCNNKKNCLSKSVNTNFIDSLIIENLNFYNENYFKESLRKYIDKYFASSIDAIKLKNLEHTLTDYTARFNSTISKASLSNSETISNALLKEAEIINLKIKSLKIKLSQLKANEESINIPIDSSILKDFQNLKSFNGPANIKDKFIFKNILEKAYFNSKSNTLTLILTSFNKI